MAWMPVFEMNPVFMQRRCLMVPRTDRANLLTEGSLIGDVGIEPVAGAMRSRARSWRVQWVNGGGGCSHARAMTWQICSDVNSPGQPDSVLTQTHGGSDLGVGFTIGGAQHPLRPLHQAVGCFATARQAFQQGTLFG